MAGSKKWYEANKERSREIARKSAEKNREAINARRRANSERNTIKNKEWRKANPEKAAVIYRRRNLKQKYGITIEQFEEMVLQQDGRCAICHSKEKLVVDHCHTSNEIRGLLCASCNRGIGLLKDSKGVLRQAITYLTRTKVK